MVIRHNHLQNIFTKFCCHATARPFGSQQQPPCPADVLVDGWERAKPVAFDLTVTSPLTPATLGDAFKSADQLLSLLLLLLIIIGVGIHKYMNEYKNA